MPPRYFYTGTSLSTSTTNEWVYHSAAANSPAIQVKPYKHLELLPGHLAKLTDTVFLRYQIFKLPLLIKPWREFWPGHKPLFIDLYKLYLAHLTEKTVTIWASNLEQFRKLNHMNQIAISRLYPQVLKSPLKEILVNNI